MSTTASTADAGDLPNRLRSAYRAGLPIPAGAEPQLAGALNETLCRPGNLIRAELAFQMAAVYGLGNESAEQLAIALEYFHTASLLFDDLPSMDDALHRRGALCIHQMFGEGAAILSALALINRGYALLWAAMGSAVGAQAAENRQQASMYLERYLGLSGILDGQSRDIHYAQRPFAHGGAPPERAQQIALEKTASLIRLPLVLPAILGGAPASERVLLHRLAMFWGLGYQALDDLKDVLRDEHEVGKTTGRDELLKRPNVALEQGTAATVLRLRRMAAIAEGIVARLVRRRPQFAFLQAVSTRFETELRATVEASERLPLASAVPSEGFACSS